MKLVVLLVCAFLCSWSRCLGASADNEYLKEKDSFQKIANFILNVNSTVQRQLDSLMIINLADDAVKELTLSSIERASHKNIVSFVPIIPIHKGQSAFNIGDTIFSVEKSGRTYSIAVGSSFSATFKFEKMGMLKPHSNVADVMDWNGEHYVYISEWDGEHRCFVEQIRFNPFSKKWLTKLVQTLSLDIPDSIRGKGNMDWIIDKENGLVYTQTYKDGSSRKAKELVYLRFRLPKVNEGDVTFRTADVEKKYSRPMIYVTQDKKIYRNQMFIASGAPGTKYKRMITVFDLPELSKSREIDLTLIDEEPEGLFFYKDELMMLYKAGIYKIQEKPTMILNFKDGRTESYALECIKSIDFK